MHCISESGGPIFRVGIVPEHDSSLHLKNLNILCYSDRTKRNHES